MTKKFGFTLIEVLIGMALLSIMMLLLFGSLRISVRNWDAGEKRIAEVSETAAVQNFFQRYLTAVRPLWDDFSEKQPKFSFQGENRQLRFVAPLPASAGRQGLQVFSVKLKKYAESDSLVVSILPFFPIEDGEEWKNEEVTLAEKAGEFKLSYFGSIEDDEPSWHDQWLEQIKLPLLVKVEMEFDDGMIWPELVVELRLSSSKSSDRDDLDDLDDLDEDLL
jgi:general secretion pathway protein J